MTYGTALKTKTGKAVAGGLAATAMFIGVSGTASAGSYHNYRGYDHDNKYHQRYHDNDDCTYNYWQGGYEWKKSNYRWYDDDCYEHDDHKHNKHHKYGNDNWWKGNHSNYYYLYR